MRTWDSLFIMLVLAPIVTGGIWLHRPDFHIEYTQPGVAALVLTAWLWWQQRQGRDPARKSVFCRAGLRAWSHWQKSLSEHPLRSLGGAWVTVSLLLFLTSLFRHRALGSGMADLGIFTNAIWNVVPFGFPYSSIKGGLSLLADHQNFLVYPLGWLFALWPTPEFLLLLQAIGLSSGAIALYYLARQRLGRGHPALPWLPIAYWMCGPLRAAGRFDFHPEVFMLPFFLFAAWLLQERSLGRRMAGLLFLLAGLAAKESAGPVACGLGLAWLLGAGPAPTRAFTRWLGLFVIALGLAVFIVDSRFVPDFFGAHYSYSDLYEPFGSSPLSLALAPFLHPLIFFGRLFAWSRWKYFWGTLLPFGFLPLFAPAALLAAAPGFLMLFLTSGDHRISLGYHYAIEPMVGILFALPVALDSVILRRQKNLLLIWMALASLLSYGRSEVYFWRVYEASAHQAWLRDEVLPQVEKERSVSASYGLVPHLATRHWVNEARILVDEKSSPVDCVLLDPSVNNTPMSDKDMETVVASLRAQKFETELRCGSFELFRRPGGGACLKSKPDCPENK